MKVILSVDHIIHFIDNGGLEKIPEMQGYKNTLEKNFKGLKTQSKLSTDGKGCTPCQKRKISQLRYVLLMTAILAINATKEKGGSIQPLIDSITQQINKEITDITIITPTVVSPNAVTANTNVGNTVVSGRFKNNGNG